MLLAEKPAQPPLALPRYTFLCSGSSTERRVLAKAIADRDMGMLVESLSSPLRAATMQLFFDLATPNYDAHLERNPPPFDYVAGGMSDWFDLFNKALVDFAGPRALCQLSRARVAEAKSFAARFLWHDTTDFDAVWFAEKFGGSNCLFIWIEHRDVALRNINPAFNITVEGTVEEQIAQIEHLVEHLPT